MLHNTGPYGPNEAPINMGAPINMSSVPGHSIPHNLNNLSKIAHQPNPVQTAHHGLPDYSAYGHPPLNMSAPMSPFANYHSMGFQPNYMPPSPVVHDTAWNNGMLPMNLNVQSDFNPNIMNYHSPYDNWPKKSIEPTKRPLEPLAHNDFREQMMGRKNMPLNIPQVPTKAFHKHIGMSNEDSYIYNDNYRHMDHNLDLSMKTQEKIELDDTRRKSLENTVKLIENILTNTTRNRNAQINQESYADTTEKDKNRPEVNILSHTALNMQANPTEKSQNRVDRDALSHTTVIRNAQIDQEQYLDPVQKSKNNLETDPLSHTATNVTEVNYSDNDNNTVASEDKLDNIESEQETDSESEKDVKPTHLTLQMQPDESMEGNNVMVSKIEIKVESSCADMDFLQPFLRDSNGIQRDDVMDCRIIESETSISEATNFIKNGLKSDTYFECPYCSLVFKHPKRFLIHTKWHSFGLTYEKRQELLKQRKLKRNQRKEAKIEARLSSKEVKDADGQKHPCKDCDKVFDAKGSLKNHRQRCHPLKTRECKICGKTMLGVLTLRAHLATHSSEIANGFQCTECPKKFKFAHSLAKHRDTHLEKTQGCPECPKMFGSQALLKMHMKTHARAQRGATYRCTYCGKGFFESYNLQVHERTHRNERPFVCDICTTSFGTNSGLKRHVKVSHNSSKPYECTICHRSFLSEPIRDRHQRRYHGNLEDFKFLCKQCPCRYMKLKDLQKHVYKVHPKGKRRKKTSDSE